MKCINSQCHVEIGDKLYCPLCGYPNMEINLEKGDISIDSNTHEGCIFISLINHRYHTNQAIISLSESSGVLTLGDATLDGVPFNTAQEIECSLKPKEMKSIEVRYKLNFPSPIRQSCLKVSLSSDDDIDDTVFINSRGMSATWRKRDYTLPIYIVKAGKLTFCPGFVSFNTYKQERSIALIHSEGETSITLESVSVPSGFTLIEPQISDIIGKSLNPGEKIELTIAYDADLTFSSNIKDSLMVSYRSISSSHVLEAYLFVVKRGLWWTGSNSFIPENIIAIDFGTSKTVAAYLKTDDLFDETGSIRSPIPEIKMVQFEGISSDGTYIPSIIAALDGRYIIGTQAQREQTAFSVSSIKSKLHENEIVLKRIFGEQQEMVKDTREVVTSFLVQLKNHFPESIRNSDNNLYLFSLPVLDSNEGASPLYARQQDMTLNAAREAGFGKQIGESIVNLDSITESDAALHYIINAIIRGEFTVSHGLYEGDVIAVYDYGAGTLDISVGRFRRKDGVPFIDMIGSLGMYKVGGEEVATNLGGNRIDNRLGMEIINLSFEEDVSSIRDGGGVTINEDESVALLGIENLEGVVREGYDGLVTDFRRFTSSSPYYARTSREGFENVFVKKAKEQFTFKGGNVTLRLDGADLYEIDETLSQSGRYLTCNSATYNSIVSDDVNVSVGRIIDMLVRNAVSEIKYIFLVGGSSLMPPVQEALRDGLRNFGVKEIITPYDYAGYSDKLRNREFDILYSNRQVIRSAATYAVAKGAVYSKVTRLDDYFQFDVRVVKAGENHHPIFRFLQGSAFPLRPWEHRELPHEANGEWEVWASYDGVEQLIDRFTIRGKSQSLQTVTFRAVVTGRVLALSCTQGPNNVMWSSIADEGEKQCIEIVV